MLISIILTIYLRLSKIIVHQITVGGGREVGAGAWSSPASRLVLGANGPGERSSPQRHEG